MSKDDLPSAPSERPPSPTNEGSFFGQSSWFRWTALIVVFALGLGTRLFDLTEPPLDFHPMRQLRGVLIARGVYYRFVPGADPELRDKAIALAGLDSPQEPPLLDSLVGLTYLVVGGEKLWVARLYSIAFWLVGSFLLYRLARRMTGEDGGLIALAYCLVIPLGVYVSRSFQPDSLMVLLLIASIAAAYRWVETRSWKWAVLTGLTVGGVALVKGRPALIVGPMLTAAVLSAEPLRRAVRDLQVWVIGSLAVVPAAVYYLGAIGPSTSGYLSGYAAGTWGLLLDPQFYFRWMIMVDRVALLGFAAVGLAAVWLLPSPGRGLLIGLWIGYGLYGLALPYTIVTHNYYSIALVPIVALSFAPLAAMLFGALARRPRVGHVVTLAVLAGVLAYRTWFTRSTLLDTDYGPEPLGWIAMGRALPEDGAIIGLTHDYGLRVAYYGWRQVTPWPGAGDFELARIEGRSAEPPGSGEILRRVQGFRYFLVTLFGELELQPALQEFLAGLPVAAEGDGFILYDLEGS